jgi:hypothetical protein
MQYGGIPRLPFQQLSVSGGGVAGVEPPHGGCRKTREAGLEAGGLAPSFCVFYFPFSIASNRPLR